MSAPVCPPHSICKCTLLTKRNVRRLKAGSYRMSRCDKAFRMSMAMLNGGLRNEINVILTSKHYINVQSALIFYLSDDPQDVLGAFK